MKTALYLFIPLLLNTNFSIAQDRVIPCAPSPVGLHFQQPTWLADLTEEMRTQNWFAATRRDVEEAPCRIERSLEDIQQVLDRAQGQGNYPDINIRGVELKNQNPELVQAFSDLVTKKDFIGHPLPEEEQPDLQAAQNCQDVRCASRALFGEEVGEKLLFMRHQYGMNGSDLVYENTSRLNTREINSFIRSLDDLPPHLLPIDHNRAMRRYKRAHTRESYINQNVLANAVMEFFDGWANETHEANMDETCTHELGHVIGAELELDTHPDWLALSGWVDLGDEEWELENPEKMISRYAETNPKEDFAETVVAYRYNPRGLKAISPEKYEFIKNHVYAGVEYLDDSQCHEVPPRLAALNQELTLVRSLSEQRRLDANQQLIEIRCGNIAAKNISSLTTQQLDECITRSLIDEFITPREYDTRLERLTLARHMALLYANTPSQSEVQPRDIIDPKNRLIRSIRDDLSNSLENSRFNYIINRDGDCETFSLIGLPIEKEDFNRYNYEVFRSSIQTPRSNISQNYCQYHLEHGLGRNINKVDALYFVSLEFKNHLPISEQQWSQVEQLRRRRSELQQELSSRNIAETVISFIIKDQRQREIEQIEAEIINILEKA